MLNSSEFSIKLLPKGNVFTNNNLNPVICRISHLPCQPGESGYQAVLAGGQIVVVSDEKILTNAEPILCPRCPRSTR